MARYICFCTIGEPPGSDHGLPGRSSQEVHEIMRLSPLLRPPIFWVAFAVLTGCGDPASPEQQVRAVIDSMETAAEARDVGDLMEHISASYRDAQGQDRAAASSYARGYFIANQSVHLLTRIESLEFPSP